MRARARFVVLEDRSRGAPFILLQDVGPWDRHPTITNDAEAVVAQLVAEGEVRATGEDRVRYLDSEGDGTFLLVQDGRFVGFAPWDGRS